MCHGIFPTGGNFSPILPINTGKPSQATGKKMFRNFLSLPKTNFRSKKKLDSKRILVPKNIGLSLSFQSKF